jgi:hypothetical protein
VDGKLLELIREVNVVEIMKQMWPLEVAADGTKQAILKLSASQVTAKCWTSHNKLSCSHNIGLFSSTTGFNIQSHMTDSVTFCVIVPCSLSGGTGALGEHYYLYPKDGGSNLFCNTADHLANHNKNLHDSENLKSHTVIFEIHG